YLHFGTEWVQGAMRLRKPDWIELEYAQQMMALMLFIPEPAHIVQLGLGTGALTKFGYRQFPRARVTAVELNPSVVAICESMFKLPPEDDRLTVLDTPEFYADCAACLAPGGMVTVNLFGDHPSYAKNLKAMKHAFADVIALPEVHDGNVVALAFKDKPVLDFVLLHERAAAIRAATKLPAQTWVNGIQSTRKA
ncbi:MAG: spermidine synthase, partial [Oxalobacteraceae bacterium]